MRRALLPLVVLTALWVILWRNTDAGTVLGGVVAASAVTLLIRSESEPHPSRSFDFVGFVVLVVTLSRDLVVANLSLVLAVVDPRRTAHRGVVRVQLEPCSDLVATIVANSVSLTPGSLTLELDNEQWVMRVHVLDASDPERVSSDIRDLQARTIRALEGGRS